MKVRTKTFLVLGTALTCLILLLYGLSSTIIIDGFKQVEQNDVKEDLERTDSAISVELSQVKSTTRDYSGWDDTYNFIQNQNHEFIETNLVNETFGTLSLNLMVFVNESKGIVFKKEVDLVQGKETTFPMGFLDILTPDCPLLQISSLESNVSGIVLIPEGPILVASYPILHSDRTGPIRGTLIFGRNLDTNEIAHLSNVTQLSMSAYSSNDPHLPSDLKLANSSFSNGSRTFVRPLSEKKIAGYLLFKDLHGHMGLIIKITMDRSIYDQGKSTIYYFLVSTIVLCIIIGIILMVLMEWFVLRRLHNLSRSIDKIGSNDTTSETLDIDGEDEFAVFAKSLRGKLESLDIIPVQEVQLKKGEADPSEVLFKISNLQSGKVYFIDEPKADKVFRVFYSLLGNGHQGLCVTRMVPKKVREAAHLEKTPIVWLSTTSIPEEKTLDPSSIARIHATIQEFLSAAKQPVVLLEGLEYLIFVNNFRFVLTMLHSLYERAVSSGGIILIVVSKQTMVPADWYLLTKDMEEIGSTLSQGHNTLGGAKGHAAQESTRES